MRTDSKSVTMSLSAADRIKPVAACDRLFHITQAVSAELFQKIQSVDWLSRPWRKDAHWEDDSLFRRREFDFHCEIMQAADHEIRDFIAPLNKLTNKDFTKAGPAWYLCEPGFRCPMHVDGDVKNVMIIYWHAPGTEYGTTFYRSNDLTYQDVLYEFDGVPNTGFYVNYQDADGSIQPPLWHASPRPVSDGSYRLMTLYYLHR